MTDLVNLHFKPIVGPIAWKISLTAEDREDAIAILLAHLAGLAEPTHRRRINPTTGKPIAGYDHSRGQKAHSFFYGAATNKGWDILKSRRAAWRREGKVLQGLLEYGPMVAMPAEPADSIADIHITTDKQANRKRGCAIAFKCFGLL